MVHAFGSHLVSSQEGLPSPVPHLLPRELSGAYQTRWRKRSCYFTVVFYLPYSLRRLCQVCEARSTGDYSNLWMTLWPPCQGAGAKSRIFLSPPCFLGGSCGGEPGTRDSDQHMLGQWSPFWTCAVCSDLGSHLTAWQPFWEFVWQALKIHWHCLNTRLVKNSLH